jgi:hypothetical protein
MSYLSLYTIILEYGGGTYISQIHSESPETAVKKWSTTITDQNLVVWGLERADLVLLSNDKPLPLENCVNIWCLTGSARNHLILLNVIATATKNGE